MTRRPGDEGIEDDRLRLIFTCCHPALAPDAQVALTLREVCGLTTEEIAQAFLSTPQTLAQRIVRARRICEHAFLPGAGARRAATRASTASCAYLPRLQRRVFGIVRPIVDALRFVGEAIRARLLVELLPEPKIGLLALMLLQESRRVARATPAGELVLLADQDRSLWDRAQIAEGSALVERALLSRRFGPYTLQAAIAAVHADAPRAEATDWNEIVGLYDLLLRADPSPVIELNRAVAVAMRDGPAAGLVLIERFSRAATSRITTLRTRHAPIFAGGWADSRRPCLVPPGDGARQAGTGAAIPAAAAG
jgi:RNA polymerase sigma-70 factor (ECF subfamily)